MIKLEFVELHGPLFLAGKNHGLKLFNKPGVDLSYSREEKELYVTYNEKTAIVPSSNISSMTALTQEKVQEKAQPTKGVTKAQASTPQDHVFSNGPGKTRD